MVSYIQGTSVWAQYWTLWILGCTLLKIQEWDVVHLSQAFHLQIWWILYCLMGCTNLKHTEKLRGKNFFNIPEFVSKPRHSRRGLSYAWRNIKIDMLSPYKSCYRPEYPVCIMKSKNICEIWGSHGRCDEESSPVRWYTISTGTQLLMVHSSIVPTLSV